MTLYTGTIILTELMMLTMVLHVLGYSGFTKIQKLWFVATFVAVMVCAFTELLAVELNGRSPSYALPLTIITVLQFSLTPLIPVGFAGALGMHKLARHAAVIFTINVIIEITAAFSGWIFYFDENGKYFHGQYYFIYEAFYMVGLVFLIVSLIRVGKTFQNRDSITIVMVLVVMLAAIIPLIVYHIYTDYIGIAISACLCYIYYNDLVQQDVQAELQANQAKIIGITERIVGSLANLIENRDFETGEHVARTSAYVKLLSEDARKDGVYTDEIDDGFINLMVGFAPLHDVGKIVVPDSVLKKPGRLTPEEYEEMKKHSAAGGRVTREILEGIADEPPMKFASNIATYHHERWDGKGYPEGLSGTDIPLAARIMAVADVYDALVSERCYKKPMSHEEACRIIEEGAGTQFDPELARVFLDHNEEFRKVSQQKL